MIKEKSNDSIEHKSGIIHTDNLRPRHKVSSSSSLSHNAQRHKRILVVDDNPENSDPTMKVYSFDNPVTALLEFKPNFYDLLLIDVNMPMMDGFQLTQKLLQKDLNVRVCFMTSGEFNMDAAREVHPLKSIGCFIKKPISTEQLVRRVRAELE